MRLIFYYIREGRYYLIVLTLLLVASLLLVSGLDSPMGGDKTPVMVVIPKGATAKQVGSILAEKGLIRTGWAFVYITRATDSAAKIKPGAYKLTRQMPVRRMLTKFVSGDVAAIWVTIPEGYTIWQIADRLDEKGLVSREDFLSLARSGAGKFPNILPASSPSLEGYLYPDTYLVQLESEPVEVVRQMLDTFKDKVAVPLAGDVSKKAPSLGAGSDQAALHKVVTIASMIEREARVDADRPLISAVIWNRLKLGMKLDIDATVQYALGEHRARLFYRDLEVDSPYNTYLHPGLPPGPIANPGVDCVKAALAPANVDYLYYVARPDGSHIFTRTLADHNAAIRRVRNLHTNKHSKFIKRAIRPVRSGN